MQRVAEVPSVVATAAPKGCQFLSRQSGEPEGWEMIFSAYLMISLNSPVFLSLNSSHLADYEIPKMTFVFSIHSQWSHQGGWKSAPPASQRFPQRIGRSKQRL
ncbi:MAG: hypothetical protein AAFO04_26365 [Cyanobacteria bacterium J06592_8]